MSDLVKKVWIVLAEALSSFQRKDGLTAASSLAFSTMLAIIPALFLLTSLIGVLIGSSQDAFQKVQEMTTQFIPGYSEIVLKEVRYIAAHKGAFGALNGIILLFAVTPLVSELRLALGAVFRARTRRHFLVRKLLDLAMTIVFLVAVTAIAVAGAAISIAKRRAAVPAIPVYLGLFAQLLFSIATVFLLYAVFSRRIRTVHLLAGAVVSAGLWFIMRPLFHLFLVYNPGFGFAFGSFKSLFVVILWIYYSLAVFLFGAEIAASIGRRETVYVRKLLEGRGGVPSSFTSRHLVRYGKGGIIFHESDEGGEMYAVRRGSVGIRKEGIQIAVIPAGKCFGEMSFLLSVPRIATAVALEDTELVIITSGNISNLMNEFPEFVVGMLREMAQRLRETNRLID